MPWWRHRQIGQQHLLTFRDHLRILHEARVRRRQYRVFLGNYSDPAVHVGDGEFDGVRILTKESTRKVLRGGRLADDDSDVTLGNGTMSSVSSGVELIGHGGGGPGFALQYLLAPEKDLVIIVLTNGTLVDAYELSVLTASIF